VSAYTNYHNTEVRQTWEFNGEEVEVNIKQDGNTWTVTPVDPEVDWTHVGLTMDYNAKEAK
jgi:hypothetical protein